MLLNLTIKLANYKQIFYLLSFCTLMINPFFRKPIIYYLIKLKSPRGILFNNPSLPLNGNFPVDNL